MKYAFAVTADFAGVVLWAWLHGCCWYCCTVFALAAVCAMCVDAIYLHGVYVCDGRCEVMDVCGCGTLVLCVMQYVCVVCICVTEHGVYVCDMVSSCETCDFIQVCM